MHDQATQHDCATDAYLALDRLLESLAHFEPVVGFEDRVMSRLVASAAPWLQVTTTEASVLSNRSRQYRAMSLWSW